MIMPNTVLNDMKIQQVYNTYQNEYKIKLPKLRKIKYVENSKFWAQCNSNELYKKNYILNINNELLMKNNNFIRQILYHEFTHLADSIQFLDRAVEDYRNIMVSYSEFHASKVEMIERIKKETNSNNITLETNITHVGTLTIKSFMEQSFNLMKQDLDKMAKNNSLESFFYDTNHIYYLYGYIAALKDFGIDYQINIYTLNPAFLSVINKIQNTLLDNNDVDIDLVLSLHISLEKAIQNQCIFNKIKNNKRGNCISVHKNNPTK
jgi:predicted SprT family Zn-dependent metalloprotease